SYKSDGRIFWTPHRLTIRRGETVFADGRNMILARCGNRVALIPMDPVELIPPPTTMLSPLEITEVPEAPALPLPPPTTELPQADVGNNAKLKPLIIPPAIAAAPPIVLIPPALFPPARPRVEVSNTPPPGPLTLPEPSSWMLFAAGAGAVATR